MTDDRHEMTPDELSQHIAIMMAAANRNPPILRGKASLRDPWERDKFRKEFAEWFVQVCFVDSGLKVVDGRRTLQGNDMASFRMRGTPPQMQAH
jgi:hypothetical protein